MSALAGRFANLKKAGALKRGKRKTGPVGKAKVRKVMHEFKHGALHSGSKTGPKVTSRRQAVAIALSEARKAERS